MVDGRGASPPLPHPAIGDDFDRVRDVRELALEEIGEVAAPRGDDEENPSGGGHLEGGRGPRSCTQSEGPVEATGVDGGTQARQTFAPVV